ncbi:hypothetical protein Tco_1112928 [Tanacetum coccineum]|uniref:Uncharacterized protein n=1 Tax=Tanacetum coccineum TaxID=301880 RepID=A0ABQ5IS74_9ASTR
MSLQHSTIELDDEGAVDDNSVIIIIVIIYLDNLGSLDKGNQDQKKKAILCMPLVVEKSEATHIAKQRIDQEGFFVVQFLEGAEGCFCLGYQVFNNKVLGVSGLGTSRSSSFRLIEKGLLIFKYLNIDKVGGGCFLLPVI